MSCTLSLRAKNMTTPESRVPKSRDIPSSVVAPNTPPAPMMRAKMRIPDDADQRSGLMPITHSGVIPIS
jgi:hypothetical protein